MRIDKTRHPHIAVRWAPPGKTRETRQTIAFMKNSRGDERSRQDLERNLLACSRPRCLTPYAPAGTKSLDGGSDDDYDDDDYDDDNDGDDDSDEYDGDDDDVMVMMMMVMMMMMVAMMMVMIMVTTTMTMMMMMMMMMMMLSRPRHLGVEVCSPSGLVLVLWTAKSGHPCKLCTGVWADYV